MQIRSYTEADAYLGRKSRRPLPGKATYLVRHPQNTISVVYHETPVVTYHPDKIISINSGGFRTLTTRSRINEYTPLRICQENGVWYVNGWKEKNDGVFADFMVIEPDGAPGGMAAPEEVDAVKALRKRVAAYAVAYAEKLIAGEIPEPSTADCWFCYMRDQATGKSLGETTQNTDHLLSHLGGAEEEPEPYYVPTLAVNALKWAGAGQAWYWGLFVRRDSPRAMTENPGQYARFIRRYLYRQLGIG